MEANTNSQSLEFKSVEVENYQNYAGFWIRFVAVAIDFGILWIFQYLFLKIFDYLYYCGVIAGHIVNRFDLQYETGKTIGYFIAGLGLQIVWWLYFALMTHKFGATFGKMLLKIKVSSNNPEALSWRKIIVREVIGKYLYLYLYGIILIGAFFYLTSDLNNSGLEPIKYFKVSGIIISFLFAIASYSMAGFTKRKQALHDKIAKTVVLHNKSS